MEYAIIEIGGRQFWIEPKKFIEFNRLLLDIGSTIILRRILFAKKTVYMEVDSSDSDNSLLRTVKKTKTFIGQPYLKDISITGVVSKHFLGPKVLVFKMRPKKKYRKKFGHRQKLTRLIINQLEY